MEPALALNVAVVALATTVTEAGTVRTLAMPPEMAITAPPTGAAPINAMVQVVLALEARLEALHCSEETKAVATSGMVADLEKPFNEAVIVKF